MTDESQEPDLLIGRTIGGKYRVDAFVGGGGMGKVYRAHHLGLQKDIAIKVLHSTFNADPKFGQRFQREALAASKLDHPNVLQVIDFGQDTDGLFYIAMEYIAGKGLDQLINEEGIPPIDRTIDILSQVCAALAVAHENGILHRDMKPENVMLIQKRDDEGHVVDLVKVCDFGIAKIGDARGDDEGKKTAALTAQGTVVGTPEYMSPEQARGEKLDARADVYAVGVILYQMCTGVIPFYAESAVGVLMRRLTEEVKPPHDVRADVDARVEEVILKAMHRDKNHRYQTIRELRADLRSLRGARGSMLPGPAPSGARIHTPEVHAATMAVATPASTPSLPGQKPTRIGEVEAPIPGPSTPIAIPQQKRSPARWFIAAGALVVLVGLGAFALNSQSSAGVDPATLAVGPGTVAPGLEVTSPVAIAAPVNVPVPATVLPETATEEVAVVEDTGHRRRRDRDPPGESTAPATAAPVTSAPVVATGAPATAAPPPVTARPATAAAPTGPLEARASISGLSVDGGLTSSSVRSAVERVVSRFESCYSDAARRANRNAAGTVNVRLTIDEGGRATGVSARGDPLPGLSSCVRGVAQRISARAPDTGTVDASFGVQFSPRGR